MTTLTSITFRTPDAPLIDERRKALGETRTEFLNKLVANLGEGGGIWISTAVGGDQPCIFATELDALRHGNGEARVVEFVPWGACV